MDSPPTMILAKPDAAALHLAPRSSPPLPLPHRRRTRSHPIAKTRVPTANRAALLLCLALASCAKERAPAPLVALLVVDTLRADALSCYGGPPDATPEIDALARRGARFDQAIASSCWTLPSVASILSGTWPELHKAIGQRARLAPVTDELPLLAEIFHARGFKTEAIVNAAFLSPELGLDRGFDRYDHVPAFNRGGRRASETVERALERVAAHPQEPLFLLVHLFDPHLDYDPPGSRTPPFTLAAGRALELPSTAEIAEVRALYQGEVAEVDRAVGRFVAGLARLGRADDATIALVADHGEELWDHGSFEHGHSLLDELVRVPMILAAPGLPNERVVDRQVRTIDLAPTLLDLCGIPSPPSFEGESLLGLARGGAGAPRAAFSQDTLYGTDQLSWRTERYHYVYDRGAGVEKRARLFDHLADPRELVDLAERDPELATKLHGELARFYAELKERGAHIPPTEPRAMGPSTLDELRKSLESLGYAR